MNSSNQQGRVEEAPSVTVEQLFSYEDEKLPQTAIFGPFWRVAGLLGLINNGYNAKYCNLSNIKLSEKPLIKRILPTAVTLVGALPLFARTFWVATQMSDFKVVEMYKLTLVYYDFLNGNGIEHLDLVKTFLKVFAAEKKFKELIDLNWTKRCAKLWSVNWAYSTLLFIFSLHSFACFVVLKVFNRKNFFDQFFKRMLEASKNKIFCQEKSGFFASFYVKYSLLGVVVLFFVYSMVWFSIENVYMLRQMQHNESSVPFFRKSMLGPNSMPLLVFDTLILVWASLVSSVTVVLIFILNNAMFKQYNQFHKEVNKLSAEYKEKKLLAAKIKRSVSVRKNGRASSIVSNTAIIQFNNNNELSYQEQHQASLNDPQILTAFDSQLIDFISLIKHCNTKTEPLITISFMCAMFSYVVSTFAVRSFKHDFNSLQNITFYNWMMLSLMFVFITLVPLAKLHTKMRDTKNLILLEKAIWKDYDPEVFAIASNMVKRIDMVDYESKLFSAIRVTSAFFNLLLLIVPIFMDYVLTPQR